MTTAALDERIGLEDISEQARQVRFGRTVATLLAGVFFALGWLPGRLWLGVCFGAVAIRAGYRSGARVPVQPVPPPGPPPRV